MLRTSGWGVAKRARFRFECQYHRRAAREEKCWYATRVLFVNIISSNYKRRKEFIMVIYLGLRVIIGYINLAHEFVGIVNGDFD